MSVPTQNFDWRVVCTLLASVGTVEVWHSDEDDSKFWPRDYVAPAPVPASAATLAADEGREAGPGQTPAKAAQAATDSGFKEFAEFEFDTLRFAVADHKQNRALLDSALNIHYRENVVFSASCESKPADVTLWGDCCIDNSLLCSKSSLDDAKANQSKKRSKKRSKKQERSIQKALQRRGKLTAQQRRVQNLPCFPSTREALVARLILTLVATGWCLDVRLDKVRWDFEPLQGQARPLSHLCSRLGEGITPKLAFGISNAGTPVDELFTMVDNGNARIWLVVSAGSVFLVNFQTS
jgi:hypothetical protein